MKEIRKQNEKYLQTWLKFQAVKKWKAATQVPSEANPLEEDKQPQDKMPVGINADANEAEAKRKEIGFDCTFRDCSKILKCKDRLNMHMQRHQG